MHCSRQLILRNKRTYCVCSQQQNQIQGQSLLEQVRDGSSQQSFVSRPALGGRLSAQLACPPGEISGRSRSGESIAGRSRVLKMCTGCSLTDDFASLRISVGQAWERLGAFHKSLPERKPRDWTAGFACQTLSRMGCFTNSAAASSL